jgi:hypothetical protein
MRVSIANAKVLQHRALRLAAQVNDAARFNDAAHINDEDKP